MDHESKAIVSAILTRKRNGGVEVFLQTRWKPNKSPTYSGMIEIPAGNIDLYESVYDALRREVKEECGLDVIKIIDDFNGPVREPRKHDKAFVFRPFICQQALETNDGLPWIGFVFLCEADGEIRMDLTEAKDPHWITVVELGNLLAEKSSTIFPLQLPVLEYFFDYAAGKFGAGTR
jgi:8-oxo-dGTP pyrophosphatase MutT (NUDIX family)